MLGKTQKKVEGVRGDGVSEEGKLKTRARRTGRGEAGGDAEGSGLWRRCLW